MKEPYLEVTFHRGKPLAAYYYLPRDPGQKSAHCKEPESGLVVDYTSEGQAIGIEIIDPSKVNLEAMNRVLHDLGFAKVNSGDLAPLKAA